MNLGIEDAAAFARRFAAQELDGYTAERHPVGQQWIAASERILAAVQAPTPPAVALRNLAILAIPRVAPAPRRPLQRVAGLTATRQRGGVGREGSVRVGLGGRRTHQQTQ